MPLEQDVKGMFIAGFIIVIAITAISLFILWNKTKNKGLLWFLPQLGFLSISLYFFIQLIDNQVKVDPAILSEENSLSLGFIGLTWGLSMISMLLGIKYSTKQKYNS